MHQSENEPVEVVVVGSGIAGSTLAAELSTAGFQVLTLEAGPKRELRDMVSSQIWARRLKWGGPPVVGQGNFLPAFNFSMGWGTGGAGLHWYANWYRFHPGDFKERTLYGRGLGWPIDYDELRPYYERAQRYGNCGDLTQEPWSPPADPYPMRPLAELPQSRVIKIGFDALDMPTAPNSLAINSRRYEDRRPCILDGWCDAGCPIGALANPLVLQWPKALGAGARLEHRDQVTKV
ncbi:MAG TPA: NAD(P)-binding protein [Vicinamibacteria bacterium]|nr:NAD(P)-binding protein [Vicinamibacteria bacterium]